MAHWRTSMTRFGAPVARRLRTTTRFRTSAARGLVVGAAFCAINGRFWLSLARCRETHFLSAHAETTATNRDWAAPFAQSRCDLSAAGGSDDGRYLEGFDLADIVDQDVAIARLAAGCQCPCRQQQLSTTTIQLSVPHCNIPALRIACSVFAFVQVCSSEHSSSSHSIYAFGSGR